MKKRRALILVLAATLLSTTVLTTDIPFVSAIEWAAENRLTTDPNKDMSPAILQARDGTAWVVWESNRIGLLNYELFYVTSSDYGSNWSPEIRLTEDPSYDTSPSIAQASDHSIWVIWSSLRTGNYELFYKTSSNNGASWSNDTQLTTDPSRDASPSVMQADDGKIWVVWASNRTGNQELFYKTYNGTAWSIDTQLTTHQSINHHPSIIQAYDETIWVVWSSNRAGNYELFYKTYNGLAWSPDTQLTNNPNFDEAPSIARASDGTIWVMWQSDRSSGNQFGLYYKIYNGSAWSSDTALPSDPADDIVASPSIAQIDDRRIWAVWQAQKGTNEGFDIYYRTSSEIIAYDVAVANVSPSVTRVNQGETVYISVAVRNQGVRNENFDVDCYANQTMVGSEATTLASGTSTTLTFSWITTGVDYGNYTIRAEASTVSGEIDTADNVYTDGKVTVTFPGDVNGDFTVNIYDLIRLNQAFGSTPGSPSWDQYADINEDNIVNALDALLLGKRYG